MKKLVLIALTVMLACIGIFTACGGEKQIMVVSRESGSGTRAGFQEILGLEDKNVKSSTMFSSTNEVMTCVNKNKNAIGYVSLGSLNDTVKALKFDGVTAAIENVKNGSYKLSRPFVVVAKKDKEMSAAAQDFKKFLTSKQAQEIIGEKGYVSISDNAEEYTAPETALSGTIKISGSTSVEPLMKALFAEYNKINSNVRYECTPNGSGAGITAAKEGTVDFGMSSRDLKDTEKQYVEGFELCKDGIVIIVNKDNTIENVAKDVATKIYKGEIKKFSELA